MRVSRLQPKGLKITRLECNPIGTARVVPSAMLRGRTTLWGRDGMPDDWSVAGAFLALVSGLILWTACESGTLVFGIAALCGGLVGVIAYLSGASVGRPQVVGQILAAPRLRRWRLWATDVFKVLTESIGHLLALLLVAHYAPAKWFVFLCAGLMYLVVRRVLTVTIAVVIAETRAQLERRYAVAGQRGSIDWR